MPDRAERRRSWWWALGLGAGFAGIFSCWSLFWLPVVHGVQAWMVPGDIWITARVSEYIRYGAYPYLYQVDSGYYSLPLGALLLTPAVAVADALGLISGYPFTIAHPTMWLVLGPASALFGIPVLLGARRLAYAWGLRDRLVLVQVLALLAAVVPCTAAGHPEDLLAVAGTCFALAAVSEGRWEQAGWWMGFAVAGKQWAVLALPAVLLLCPAGRRRAMTTRVLLLPLALLTPCMVLDHTDALRAMLLPTDPHGVPWGHPGLSVLLAGGVASRWSRPAAVALSVALAARFARRRPARVGELVAVAFVLRALTEPLLLGYYLAPALLVGALALARRRGGLLGVDVACAALVAAWSLPEHVGALLWWSGAAVVAALVVAAQLAAGRSAPPHRRTSSWSEKALRIVGPGADQVAASTR